METRRYRREGMVMGNKKERIHDIRVNKVNKEKRRKGEEEKKEVRYPRLVSIQ